MIRYTRRHPVPVFLLGILALAALNTALQWAWALWNLLPCLLALAAAMAAAHVMGKRGRALPRRPAKVIRGRAEDDAEVIRLRAEVEALRAERDQARESAKVAWEGSTGPGVTRDQILADPRSGARPFGGAQ